MLISPSNKLCDNWTDCLFEFSESNMLKWAIEINVIYFGLEQDLKKTCRKCRSLKIEIKLEEILRNSLPLNGMQVCRIINGAKGKYDIKFCRNTPGAWRDPNRFKNQKTPYPNCKHCEIKWVHVYYYLKKLEAKESLDSRIEYRSDPINPNRKDKMRMWAIKGRLPKLEF